MLVKKIIRTLFFIAILGLVACGGDSNSNGEKSNSSEESSGSSSESTGSSSSAESSSSSESDIPSNAGTNSTEEPEEASTEDSVQSSGEDSGENSEETENTTSTNSKKLLPPQNGEIYFGAFAEFGGVEDGVTTEKINKFDDLAGKPTAWSYFSNNWYEYITDDSEAAIKYPKDNIRTVHNSGKTPFIRLLPWTRPKQIGGLSSTTRSSPGDELVPICYQSANDGKYTYLVHQSEVTSHQNNGSTVGDCTGAFLMKNIVAGDWDDELRQWAREAKADRDSNGEIIPLLVSFTIEMNGYWFPWSGIYNGGPITDQYGDPNLADGPESYRDAYRHIIDLFREEQVENITWFFIPDTLDPNEDWVSFLTESWNDQKNYYPGDDYIDWIGTNLYGAASKDYEWSYFSDDLSIKSAAIKEISSTKPVALMEFGVIDGHADGTKSDWFVDAFNTITSGDYLQFQAISYWHDTLGSGTPAMKIDSSPESLATFKSLISNPKFISTLRFE